MCAMSFSTYRYQQTEASVLKLDSSESQSSKTMNPESVQVQKKNNPHHSRRTMRVIFDR